MFGRVLHSPRNRQGSAQTARNIVSIPLLARALWREGYDDHLAGHITINRGDGTLWCNPWLLHWEEVALHRRIELQHTLDPLDPLDRGDL